MSAGLKIKVYYVLSYDTTTTPARDMAKFFDKSVADDFAGKTLGSKVEMREEWAHEQHPAHQAQAGVPAPWETRPGLVRASKDSS